MKFQKDLFTKDGTKKNIRYSIHGRKQNEKEPHTLRKKDFVLTDNHQSILIQTH